jgi:crotonobetainyl-CoA:carnitine CoA-transferase CaiB-like acyl-CoA transferase
VAVQTDAQWEALRDALGRPAWAMAAELTTAAGRRAAHDLIDEHLGDWCSTRSGAEVVETLWSVGIPVAKVMQPHRQTELPQLQHRRFFEKVGHPANEPAPHSTLPINLANGPSAFHREPAPMLGEHNHDILTALGLTDAEIMDLAEDGVIGTAPGVGRRRKAVR